MTDNTYDEGRLNLPFVGVYAHLENILILKIGIILMQMLQLWALLLILEVNFAQDQEWDQEQ